MLRSLGHEVETLHPPKRMSHGILSLIRWWAKQTKALESAHHDLLFLHQPMLNFRPSVKVPVISYFHVSYTGKAAAFAKYFPFSWERQYYRFVARLEKDCMSNLRGYKILTSSQSVASDLGSDEPLPFYVGFEGVKAHGQGLLWIGRNAKVKNREYAEEIQRYIHPLITFATSVPHGKMSYLMSCHKYILSTSVYEGLPVSLLEGISCGLIPLVSDIPPLSEVVSNVKGGCTFNLNDPSRAAAQIVDYMSRPRTVDFNTIYGREAISLKLKKCIENAD